MIDTWKEGIDYPEWMKEEGLKTLKRQHLLENETPKEMYERISDSLYERLMCDFGDDVQTGDIDRAEYIKNKWFEYMWKGWLCPATPILANTGTTRGFTISCFIERVEDSLDNIYLKTHELAMLTKMGGGVGVTFDKVRGRGEPISVGGFSEGVVPFLKVYDSAIIAANQGSVRRGAASINLPVRHKDIREFLKIRQPKGDVNRQCLNLNHCITIDDFFMESVKNKSQEDLSLWAETLSSRMKTGQPYIMYYHNANRFKPVDMIKRNLKIDGTNICTEIMAPHDKDHTVVCDLASINLIYIEEIMKDTEFIELSLLFLDTNMSYFIRQAKGKPGFENAVRFAKKSRLLGLGVLGWHTFLQKKKLPFNSLQTRAWINKIGSWLKEKGSEYNSKYGSLLGNPEWCDSNRNLALFAIAPTTTNSLVSGGVSQGIEPVIANAWVQQSAKGTFIRRNSNFEKLIAKKYSEYNTPEFWNKLAVEHKGSCQWCTFLTDEEKEVFLTAYEINQLELVRSAAIWQKYIDQGISLNLFFPADVDPKWFNKIHITAWEEGIKSLYYVRTESILSRDMKGSTFEDCLYCEA
jgi:ribonucleoside-diphosphate reductase alpha chain